MILRGLLLGFLLLFLVLSATEPSSQRVISYNDTDIYDDDGARYVKQLLDPEQLAKNDSIIVVSFLAAISQVSQEIGNLLRGFSQSRQTSSADSSSAFETKHASTVGNLHNCFRMDFDGSMIAGALKVAVDDINERTDILPNHVLHYIFKNTCGDEQISTQAFMDHWKMGARVFIGPESNCRTEAQMAAAQNLPIISYKCRDKVVSDKKKYTTFSRTAPAETDITRAFVTMMKEFKWRKFSVIYESTTQANRELMEALRDAVENENKNAFDGDGGRFTIQNTSELHQFSEIGSESSVDSILEATKGITRIYVTFGSVRLFRKILQTMGQKGMMNTQEYMLIYLDPDYNWLDVYHAMNNHFVRNTMVDLRSSWDNKNSSDSHAVNYLKNAMAIIPTPVDYTSEKFVKFWNRSTQYLNYFGVYKDHDHKWSVRYNRFACYLYDAVMIYAKALHQLMDSSDRTRKYDPIRDGIEITKRISGSYESICGFTMTINENHDAKGNYTLLSWQPVERKTGRMAADYYPHDFALDITGVFIEDGQGQAKIQFNKKVLWTDDEIPKDQPNCGFHDELCAGSNLFIAYITFFLVFIFAAVGALAGGYSSYRTRKVESELHSIWKIDPNEITDHTKNADGDILTMISDNREFLDTSNDKIRLRDTGIYKGSNVWIKELVFEKPLNLSRKMKVEMRIMRQLSNNNINPFLGVFFRNESMCVVRDYCARGSLMDTLQNKDMKLDDVFITSFVDDLIRGMSYLHESDLGVHGNLKSTNCLLTTRWVLQVADFGLFEMREGRTFKNERARWDNLLWTAPELLKESSFGQIPIKPTKAADVYSFGVILHEIVMRLGPYSCMTPEAPDVVEVIRNAAAGNHPHIGHGVEISRPVLETMKQCFSPAADRPDFKYGIRTHLRDHFEKQKRFNIMDHMLEVMEQYQAGLEEKILERTRELQEEQERSETLLQRMLPPAVANQLLQGHGVIPEVYPGVTIYFSDIVGFTRISGESEPIDVVKFLNKLYTLFDEIIQQYSVYKVETIGDAYMVVGGVPCFTSKLLHAEQISIMALHLLSAVKNFTIPHLPQEKLLLRIGVHTGSCVGGIVGSAMPRFCLFGDTVNTASRMETNGDPLRIHCSEETKKTLDETKGDKFILEKRGYIPIKGKGDMTTYWLMGRENLEFSDIPDPMLTVEMGKIAPDIFPRLAKANPGRDSAWGVNRDSTLSLVKDFTFMRKHDKPAPPKVPQTLFQDPTTSSNCFFSNQNGGMVSLGSSVRELASVNEEEPWFGKRSSQERNRLTFGRYPRTKETIHENDVALRKRSTSLPDGEKLNLDLLEQARKHHDTHSLNSGSPSPSQYPSYRDLHTEVQRKRGMTLTVWPLRKRSLSVGDTLPLEQEAISQDLRQHLLEEHTRKARKAFRAKDRKSVLSLHGSFFREPSPLTRLREASPFGRRIWGSRTSTDRSRAESLNRFLRRLTNTGSEYTGLTDSTDGSEEQVAQAGSNEGFIYEAPKDQAKEPLIKTAELMV